MGCVGRCMKKAEGGDLKSYQLLDEAGDTNTLGREN